MGWKLIHGDVFKPITHCIFMYVGIDDEFFGMPLILMIFSILGLHSPSNHVG